MLMRKEDSKRVSLNREENKFYSQMQNDRMARAKSDKSVNKRQPRRDSVQEGKEGVDAVGSESQLQT